MSEFPEPAGTATALKRRVSEYWHARPCGSDRSTAEFGSLAWFREIETARRRDIPMIARHIAADRFRGKRILEVGTGLGSDLIRFARGGAHTYGVDLTEAACALAARRFGLEGHASRFARTDAESLPFPDGTFDAVYSWGVLHHTPGTARAVEEVRRVLRRGGEAFVMLYHRRSFAYLRVLLEWGVLRGGLLTKSPQDLLNEASEFGDSPLTRAYTKAEILDLFERFTQVGIRIGHLPELDPSRRDRCGMSRWFGFLPAGLFDFLESRFGWCALAHARK